MTEGEEREDRAAATVLRCAGIEVDPATRQLWIEGVAVTIERRAFDLLVYLMRHAGRVVDKDELLREVWQSRPVSESTVAQAASRVRRALGGEPDEWIATVYGVGYRFTGEVVSEAPVEARVSGAAASARPPRWRTALWILPALVVLAAVIVGLSREREGRPEQELLVAVLPVQNRTLDAQLDWVELGILPLIDQALEEGGARSLRASQVVSTLRRYPEAREPEAQARVLRLNAEVDRVLLPRLLRVDAGYRLELRSVDAGPEDGGFQMQGEDITVLAVAAGTSISESLARWRGGQVARRSLVTDDAFVNEAFARGLDARLRGRWEDAARFFDTVLAAAPELLEAKYQLALVTRSLGDWDYTEQLHQELLDEARQRGDRGMEAAAESVSGTLAWRRGKPEAAEGHYQRALALYQELNHARHIASTQVNLGILSATRGRFESAEQRMRDALVYYRATGDRFNTATTLKNLGTLLSDQGRYEDAESILQESLDIRQTLELPLEVAKTLSVLGDVEMARGRWSQALAYQQRVLETADEYDNPTLGIQARSDLSAAYLRLGRLEDAVTMAVDAQARAVELGSRSNVAFALLQQGRAELARGRALQAEDRFRRAADIYAAIDQPTGEALARIARIDAWLAAGQVEEAGSAWLEARAKVEQLNLDRLRPPLYRAEAGLALARGEPLQAIEALEAAHALALDAQIPTDVLDTGGALGLVLFEHGGDDARLATLAERLRDQPEASAEALQFLVRYTEFSDPPRALAWAEQRRALIGEAWTDADQHALDELRARTR